MLMQLRSGIPRLADVDALTGHEIYRQHLAFNEQFLATHADALAPYARRWGRGPLQLWSRRWEYPYAAQRLLAFLADAPGRSNGALHVLDAGGQGIRGQELFVDERRRGRGQRRDRRRRSGRQPPLLQ
ncbi:MAG: hypothetical protein ABI629_16260 [bacterium]